MIINDSINIQTVSKKKVNINYPNKIKGKLGF